MHAVLALVIAGCATDGSDDPVFDELVPNWLPNAAIGEPVVLQDTAADCQPNERLITDVCTELGPADECTQIEDVCIALCDGLQTCTTTGDLRPINGWPTAPDGYCVECDVP